MLEEQCLKVYVFGESFGVWVSFDVVLYQVIEVKEGVWIKEENQMFVIVIFQNYFCFYDKFVGMIGIVVIEVGEFVEIYGFQVVEVFINVVVVRVDEVDVVYVDEEYKYEVFVDDIVQ